MRQKIETKASNKEITMAKVFQRDLDGNKILKSHCNLCNEVVYSIRPHTLFCDDCRNENEIFKANYLEFPTDFLDRSSLVLSPTTTYIQ